MHFYRSLEIQSMLQVLHAFAAYPLCEQKHEIEIHDRFLLLYLMLLFSLKI